MNKFTKNIIAILLIVTLVYSSNLWLNFSRRKWKIEEIKQTYKGIILDIFTRKGSVILHIKTTTGKLLKVGLVDSDLIYKAEVGDSIYKIKNYNYCILNNNQDTLRYLYNPRETGDYVPDTIKK